MTVAVELPERKGGRAKIKISPPESPEIERREAIAIGLGYKLSYEKSGSIPSFETAREIAAYLLVPPGAAAYGDVKRRSPVELARIANVTEEFAQFRIALDVQNQ
ncbi:MAG: hypothetical protein HY517_02200 [Candidatus Aenigmarchaeota archaeon]|nr:hypothetical protein [Candidatus Aenigmarchaeota archaeon]